MQTLVAVPEDSTITVDGVQRQVAMPEVDPNIRAVRYNPNKDSVIVSFEVRQGFKDALTGEAAEAFIQPFADAWSAADAEARRLDRV